MQKAVSELEHDKQHWTAQAKAAGSEKVEISKRAAALTLQLESLISSRDRNYQATKEKQYKAELEMELKKDECSRMQKQLKSYAGLLSSLEAELMKTRQAFADAKTMVSENCRLVSRQEEKLQKVIVGEERFLGKIKRQAAGFKTLRARLHEKDEALKELGLAHDTAARQLASSKTEAAELKRTGGILEAAEKEHIAGKNILHRSLQRSNALLAEARSASEQHRAALDALRERFAALNAETLERAASDAATVEQQGLELAALRSEVEKLRTELASISACKTSASSLQDPSIFVLKHADQIGADQMMASCDGLQTGTQSAMAAQSPAQPAKTEKGEACSKEPQGQASVLQQSSLQKNDAAQEEVEVSRARQSQQLKVRRPPQITAIRVDPERKSGA
ncbi:hypothetical protein WJX75_008113 [Coccomyxa subellipsoidea]|uniref:Basal body-orientation factor 1 n=1 Tax=Coccomyxa subellipsoidea TaxID=248742 RepID=A0ABR2YGV1_9CHLO